MFYIYDRNTDTYSRMLAKPFMGRGSPFVELTEEDFNAKVKAQAEARKPKPELFEESSADDLTSGVTDGEDG